MSVLMLFHERGSIVQKIPVILKVKAKKAHHIWFVLIELGFEDGIKERQKPISKTFLAKLTFNTS